MTVNGVAQPLLFTWTTPVPSRATGWAPNEVVQIVLHGPLDSPGVHPGSSGGWARGLSPRRARLVWVAGRSRQLARRAADIPLGVFTADVRGSLSGAPRDPFDSGIVGPQARIPRPGYYEVRAVGRASGTSAAADRINLCPDTAAGHPAFNWGTDRGGRDGPFPRRASGSFRRNASTPNGPRVGMSRRCELYGVVAPVREPTPINRRESAHPTTRRLITPTTRPSS